MNDYYYQTDAESGVIEADTVADAYAACRAKISDLMIADGATLWVEPDDESSTEGRITLGLNAV